MNENCTTINVNYEEALFLSSAITYFLRNLSISPKIAFPNADIDYIIGQVQTACELLEE